MLYIKNNQVTSTPRDIIIGENRVLNPTHEQILEAGYSIYTPEQPDPLTLARSEKLSALRQHDTSSEVNEFFYQGQSMWFNKDTRKDIMLGLLAEQREGQVDTTLIDTQKGLIIPISVEMAISIMDKLEVYAKQAFTTTARHQLNIEQLTSLEEMIAYDFKVNYPQKLSL